MFFKAQRMETMLIESLTLPLLITGLFFTIILSIAALLSCKLLQEMPNNGKESESIRNSWTGPVRSSYIAVAITLLLLAVSVYLLASTDKILIIAGIGLMIFSVMIPATTSILAFAVMNTRRHLMPSSQTLADHNNGRLSIFN